MPHTLVTGANSFVAAHIISELIASGHTITGCVRRVAAGEDIFKTHSEWKEKLDFVVVEDYTKEGVFDDIFKSKQFDYVVHVATPIPSDPANMDFEATWIKPSIASVLSILRSAATHAPTVKSIVITGSIVAVTSGLPDEIANVTFTNESWNPITPALAQASGNHMAAYASSKKEAELVIWDFVKTASPHFTVTVLLPTLVLGPPIQHIPALKNINATVGLVYTLINGTYEELPNTHTFLVPNYIDVRDLATAHVRALTEPAVANKRLVIGRMGLTTTLIVDTLRALAEKPEAEGGIPALKGRLPVDKGGDAGALTMKIDAEEGNEALKLTFRSTEETFGDMAKKLLELEKELGGKYERGIL